MKKTSLNQINPRASLTSTGLCPTDPLAESGPGLQASRHAKTIWVRKELSQMGAGCQGCPFPLLSQPAKDATEQLPASWAPSHYCIRERRPQGNCLHTRVPITAMGHSTAPKALRRVKPPVVLYSKGRSVLLSWEQTSQHTAQTLRFAFSRLQKGI